MRKLLGRAMILLLVTFLFACGGGGGSNSTRTVSAIKAVIKPSALTAGLNIAGIDLSISIPYGVAPPLALNGSVDSAATVEITSTAPQNQTQANASYTPATATTAGQTAIFGIAAAGFKATDQITIHLKVADGTFPVESDFTLLSFKAFDTNGLKVFDKNAPGGTNIIELAPTLSIIIQ